MPYFPPPPPDPPRWSARPHERPQPYLRLLRTPHHRWWKSLLGLLLVLSLWVASQVALVVVLLVRSLVTGGSLDDALLALDHISPGTLLLTNLALAVFIPITGIAVLVCHQERMGWLFSVLGRVRWRLLAGYAGFAVLLMGVSAGVGFVLPGSGGLPGLHLPPAGELIALTAVFLLTTPLQAAGEEFLFRGYLAQAIGSWIPTRVAALLVTAPVTALLFALAHGPQDPWLFADRFGFGIAASVLVWVTGGLEAAIALHALNNLAAFAFSTLTGTLDSSVTATDAPAPGVALDLVTLTVFTAGVWLWTVRRPVRTVSDVAAPRGDAGAFWRPR